MVERWGPGSAAPRLCDDRSAASAQARRVPLMICRCPTRRPRPQTVGAALSPGACQPRLRGQKKRERLPPESEVARGMGRWRRGQNPSPFGTLELVVAQGRLWPELLNPGRASRFANPPKLTLKATIEGLA